MSRETVATIKNPANAHKPQSVPREGTRIRKMYDALTAQPGKPVSTHAAGSYFSNNSSMVNYLRDGYLLDIRPAGRGFLRLCGRWEGDTYIDYVAPQFTPEGVTQ